MTNWVGTPGKDSVAIAGPRPWVDVRAYGAKGDGVADDTAAFVSAYTALPSAGGRILGPAGAYIVNGWELSGPVCFEGAGSGKTILKSGSGNTAGYIILLSGTNRASISGVSLDGNGVANIQNILVSTLALDTTIEDVESYGAMDGIVVLGGATPFTKLSRARCRNNSRYGIYTLAANTAIEGCWAHANTSHGIYVDSTAHRTRVADCIAFSNLEGIYVKEAQGVSVVGGHIFANTNSGIVFYGADDGIVSGAVTQSNGIHGLTFISSRRGAAVGVISLTNGAGVQGDGLDWTRDVGAFSYGSEAGVAVGCISRGNFGEGITRDTDSNGGVISGNISALNKRNGIRLYRSNSVSMVGNYVDGNGQDTTDSTNKRAGIEVDGVGGAGADSNIIANNIVVDTQGVPTQQKGILVWNGASRQYLSNNRVEGNVVAQIDASGSLMSNSGATSVADGGTITHGLAAEPTKVRVTPTVAGEMASVTAVGATTFTVALRKHDGTAGTTQTVYFEAEV